MKSELFGIDVDAIGGEYPWNLFDVCTRGRAVILAGSKDLARAQGSVGKESIMSAHQELLAKAGAQTEFDAAERSPLEKVLGD